MYPTINISSDVRNAVAGLNRLGTVLSAKQINRAVSLGINDTLRVGRTEARTAVKRVYTISQAALSGRIETERSTSYSKAGRSLPNTFLTGAIVATSTPVPANFFKLTFVYKSGTVTTISKRNVQKSKRRSPKSVKGGGVTFEALKGKVETYPHAFLLPTMSNRVFARGEYKKGGSFGWQQRLGPGSRKTYAPTGNDSVKPLIGVSVHGAAINPKVQGIIYNLINVKYLNNVTRHLGLVANGINI